MRALALVVAVLLAGTLLATGYFETEHRHAIAAQAAQLTGGDPRMGRKQIEHYGCKACHVIPGFRGTEAHVGPPLNDFALRAYIGGVAENKPENLIRFLHDPRSVSPHGAMPNLHVSDSDARDLAAFLYTLQ